MNFRQVFQIIESIYAAIVGAVIRKLIDAMGRDWVDYALALYEAAFEAVPDDRPWWQRALDILPSVSTVDQEWVTGSATSSIAAIVNDAIWDDYSTVIDQRASMALARVIWRYVAAVALASDGTVPTDSDIRRAVASGGM